MLVASCRVTNSTSKRNNAVRRSVHLVSHARMDNLTINRPETRSSRSPFDTIGQDARARANAVDAGSDLVIELTPVERIFLRTPLLGIGEYKCRPDHPQFSGGGPEACPYIVFSRSSVRLLPNRGPKEVCTPVTVNLLDVGDSYERQAVSADGANCEWIAISPTLLREIAGFVSADLRDRSTSVFRRCVAPISARTFLAQRMFFSAVRASTQLDALAVEEATMALVEAALREALLFDPQHASSAGGVPRKNGARARELVEAAKAILSRECWSNLSVTEIAARVHCSPAYLSRTFSRLSGLTLHEYQQQIRLRASLDLLAEGRFNGAGIASQLGFASHSHFTDVFHRCFGVTPRAFARSASLAKLAEMHQFLDARKSA